MTSQVVGLGAAARYLQGRLDNRAKLELSRKLSITAEEAWAHVSDLSSLGDWLEMHQGWRSDLPDELAVGTTIVGVAGSFLVPYVRAKAEALGLRGDVGLGSRAERVVVITAGLVLAPWWHFLDVAIYLLAALAWLTVVWRVLFVRKQLLAEG